MTRVLAILLVIAFGAGPSPAQVLSDTDRGMITVLLPQEWTGVGVRGPDDGGITFTGETVMVEGLAHHHSGVVRVTVDGNPAIVLRDSSGATRFRTRIPPPAPGRPVEIVAYPVDGAPFVRVQFPNGTHRMARLSTAPAPDLDSPGPAHVLRVALASPNGDPSMRRAVGALPGVAIVPADAHLTIETGPDEYRVVGRDGSIRHRIAGASGSVLLAQALEQERTALQFAEFGPPWNGFGVEFRFPSGEGVFPLGTAIEFTVRSERDGYLTVVDLGTDGTVGLLYPVLDDDPRILAAQEVRLPSVALQSLFAPDPPYRATAPVGSGVVRAFVTPRPLRLRRAEEGSAPSAAELLRALAEAVAGPEPWGAATLGYRVVP